MQDIINRPDKPFCMSCAGPRGSGKSYLYTELLKKIYKRFKHVHVMSQSLDSNHDFDDFIVDPDKPDYLLTKKEEDLKERFVFHKHPTAKEITDIIDDMEEEKCFKVQEERFGVSKDLPSWHEKIKNSKQEPCPQVLIILDDCLDTGLLNRRGLIDTLAERGRHMNISVIVTTQMYKKLSLNVRNNSEFLFFFSPYSYGELEKYLEDFVPRELLKYARKKFVEVFELDYHFILISSIHSSSPLKKLRYGDAKRFFNNTLQYVLPQSYDMEDVALTMKKKRKRVKKGGEAPFDEAPNKKQRKNV